MRNVLAIFIAIIFSFNTMAYARELKGVVSGNANDVYSATFKFSADNTDQQLLKKDNSPLNSDDVCSYYNTIDGMKIFVDGIDIASSKYSYPKKIMGLDLSDVAGWPRINIPAGCVGIDPKLGRFKFSEGNNDSPTLLSTFDTYDVSYGVSVVDTVAFVASFRSGLYALDVTNPKKPLLINNYNTTGWAYEVCVRNNYAFVADAYSGLQIIDVSNPKNLTLVGNCATNGWAYDIFVEGRYAYLADYRLGLQIIDVQNPAKPEIVGNCRTDSTAYGVWVSGQYAYLADGLSGLRIIDVSNPDSPRLVSTYDTKGKAYDVQVVGKYAFVADGQCSGLQIIDVSNPAAPKLVGCCTTPGIASKIHVLDGYAYIADGQNSGLQIINVSDVNNPIIVASCKTSGKAYGIFLSGKNAFVADGSNGLHIIDVPHPCEAPKGKVTVDCLLASNADFSIDSTPPVVTGVFPSNKLAAVPVDTDVVINFSEIMNPSLTEASFGISPDPGTRAYKWSNDGKTITIDLQRFSYDSLYNCVVTTQSVDLCGNHLPQSYTWSFYTEKQATTTLQSTLFSPTPAGGNEYDITWQITGGKPPYLIDLYYSTDGGKVYLPITQNTIGTSYRWRVPQVNFNDVKLKVVAIDASGAQVNSVNQIDSLPPQVVQTIPANNAIDVASNIGTITVVFNEGMNHSQTQDSFTLNNGVIIKACHSIVDKSPGTTTNITSLIINGYEWNAANTILKIGVNGLQPDTEYACMISNQARDIVGNTLTTAYKWNFKTMYENGLIMASLFQPDGILCLVGGSSQSVQWQVSGGTPPYSTELYYTTGSGTWVSIASAVVSPYKWTVPVVNSEDGQLKLLVTDAQGTCIKAVSNMFGIDSIPPTVASSIPAKNMADVDIATNITIDFSEKMNTSKTQEAFVISPDPGISGYCWSNGSKTLTIEFMGTLSYNTTYTCMISNNVREFCAGNQLAGSFTWSFTTRKVCQSLQATLISLNGGQCLAGGRVYDIVWSVSGGNMPYTAALYYTTGSGTWVSIAGNAVSPYNWSVPMLNSEGVQIKIVIKDTQGVCIETVSNIMKVDSTPPAVINILPINNVIDVSRNTTIVINFSEEMNITETQNSFVIIPNPGSITYTWSNGTSTLIIKTAELNYDTRYTCMITIQAKDTCAGNPLAQAYKWTFKTKQDISPLKVALVQPQGLVCVAGGSQQYIEWQISGGLSSYTSAVYYTVGSGTWVLIANNVVSPYRWSIPQLNSEAVRVKVVVKDNLGVVVEDVSGVFEIDSIPPSVIETMPANAAISVGLATNITINFSEEMNIARTQQAFVISPNPGILSYRWSNGTKTLTVELNSLAYNTRYDCVLTAEARDTCAGNQLPTNYTWSFTTQEKEIPLSIDLIKPDNNLKCLAGGAVYDICWAVSGGKLPYDTRIFYALGSTTWTCITAGQIQSPYTWIVPKADTMNAQIKVMVIDAAGREISDISEKFEIDSTPPTVASVTPANGLTDVDISSDMIIEFSEEMNHLTQDAFSILPHPGVYGFSWSDDGKRLSIDLGTLSYNTTYICMVSRCAHDNCSSNHMTNNFVWSFNTRKVFQPLQTTVISPNGGGCLAGDRQYDISWTVSGGVGAGLVPAHSASLYYCLGSNTQTLIADNVKQSPYKWLVPMINSMDARVKVVVTDSSGAQASDMSDASFEIDSIPPQIISVQSADGKVNVATNTTIVVTFSEEMNTAECEKAFMIIPKIGVKGYTWNGSHSTMTVTLDSLNYDTQYSCIITNQAKDTCAGNQMLKNYNWSFTTERLVNTLAVSLISPNGEKPCIAGGSKWPVSWTVSGGVLPHKVSLYYSMDSGSTWVLFAGDAGSSPYLWQVPAIDSLQVRLKVVITDAGGQQVSDMSDVVFEIDSILPTVVSVSPANGVTNVSGSSTTIVIKFSEEMNMIATQEAFSISPNPGIESYTWADGTSTLTIKVKPLTPDVKYYCQISKTARDTCAGNQIQAIYEWSFIAIKPFDSFGARIFAPNGGNTLRGEYSIVPSSITLPSSWGWTIPGSGSAVMEDVATGDADNDGKNEVYGVCGSYIYQFKWNGATRTSTMIGTQKAYGFHAVTVGDADNDGKNEIYVAYGPIATYSDDGWNGGAYQYKWDGSKWVEAWVSIGYDYCYGNYSGGTWKGALDVKIGDVDNDGQKELWLSDSKGYVYQLKYVSGGWHSMFQTCAGPCYTFMTGIEIGDADGDGKNELYGAKNDGNIYRFKFVNNAWTYGTITNKIGTQIAHNMGDGIGIGDGDNDGKLEIYQAVKNGPVYQVKYNGTTWATTKVMENSCGYAVVVGDGDCDGKKDVFAVDMTRRVYQLNWNGTFWDKTDIGEAGAGLMQGMTMGDGNNDSGLELYEANEDKCIYQFKMGPKISVDIQGRLIEGQTNAIKWEAIGGTPPYLSTLYYSIDGGYSYTLISANIGTFTFDWKVPTVNSKACLVKVVVTDNTGRSGVDTSDGFFEIDCIPPQIANVSPTGQNIPITADVVIGFDDVMNTAYTAKAFSISPGVIINGYRWESYNNVMVVDLDNLSYDTEYTCRVDTNAIDTCTGNSIIGVYTWKFKTVAQPDIPLPLKVELNCRGEVTQSDKISNTIRLTKEGDWYQKWGWDEYMVVYKLDPNMSYTWASPYGYYNAASNTLTWWVNMKDLPPGSSTAVWRAEINAMVLSDAKPGTLMENKLMIYPGAIPGGIEPWLPMKVSNNTLVKYTGTQTMNLPSDWRVEEMMLSNDLMKKIDMGYWKERLLATGMITNDAFSSDKDWTNDYYYNDFLAILKNKLPQQFVFDKMKWKAISPWSVKALSKVIATPAVIDTAWKKVKIGASVGDFVIGAVVIGDVDNNGRQEIYYGDEGNYLYQCKWNGNVWEAKQIAKMEWPIEAITVGDGDNDGNDELYVVGKGRPVYQFEWDGAAWVRTLVGEDGDGILSVTIGDGNNDGINEIYVGCKNDWVYQFAWKSGFWVKSSVGECDSDIFKISIGDADNDGKKDMYIACEDGFVYSFKWVDDHWIRAKIARPDSSMFSVAVGDGDNDGKEEIYGVCFDGHAYQFRWHEKGWITTDMGIAGGPEERDGACSLQDGDNDGKYELYVSSKSGHVYQFKWDGASWMRSDIGDVNVPLHYVAIGDGDGDGLYDVYAADGGVYQFKVEPQLSLRVETQKEFYASKEMVKMVLKVTNYGSSERVLKFKTTKSFDLRIKSLGSGCVVYDWAYNKTFADGMAIIRLAPGEEQVLAEIDWDQKDLYGSNISGGRYCIEGNLASGRAGSHMEMRAKSKEMEVCSAVPLWIPAVAAQQPYTEFDVEVKIGSITSQIKDLFGAAFRLNYNVNEVRLSVIRVDAGSLLGSNVVSFASSVDTNKGFVDIGLSRKRETGIGVDGYGIVAKVRIRVDYISGSSLKLSLSNVDAVNSKGEHILMEAQGTEIPIGRQVNIWPGDANNDGFVDANDITTLAYYWQQIGYPRKNASCIWAAQVSSIWCNQYAVYADTNGDGVVDGRDILSIGLNWGQKKIVQGAPGLKMENNINCVGAYQEMYKVLAESPETTFSEELKNTLKGLITQAVATHVPAKSSVLQNYPNPFNSECWIPFELAERARVVIRIYNLTGQLIQTLDHDERDAGTYMEKNTGNVAVHWDGRNEDGEAVASGVYFYRLEAGGQVSTRKMVIVK